MVRAYVQYYANAASEPQGGISCVYSALVQEAFNAWKKRKDGVQDPDLLAQFRQELEEEMKLIEDFFGSG